MEVDATGCVYVAGRAGPGFPVTQGAFQTEYGGSHYNGFYGSQNGFAAKLSPTGELLASTLVGGSGSEGADGIYVDTGGNVLFVGQTDSDDFPVTPGAFQQRYAGGKDAVVVRLSSDFSRVLYSTYVGGTAFDTGRSAYLGADGSLYLTGAVDGPGWPVKNAYQARFAGGSGGWGNGDCILIRFKPTRRGG